MQLQEMVFAPSLALMDSYLGPRERYALREKKKNAYIKCFFRHWSVRQDTTW